MKPWVLEYNFWPQFDPCPHVILSETVNPVSINPYHVLYDDWMRWIYDHYLDTPVLIDLSRSGQMRFSTKAAAMHFKLAWGGR
jgi:hypothetical protein